MRVRKVLLLRHGVTVMGHVREDGNLRAHWTRLGVQGANYMQVFLVTLPFFVMLQPVSELRGSKGPFFRPVEHWRLPAGERAPTRSLLPGPAVCYREVGGTYLRSAFSRFFLPVHHLGWLLCTYFVPCCVL